MFIGDSVFKYDLVMFIKYIEKFIVKCFCKNINYLFTNLPQNDKMW